MSEAVEDWPSSLARVVSFGETGRRLLQERMNSIKATQDNAERAVAEEGYLEILMGWKNPYGPEEERKSS